MSHAYTRDEKVGHAGPLSLVTGTFTESSTSTGGTIVTGLTTVQAYNIGVASTTFTITVSTGYTTGTLTLVTTSGANGTWMAAGW